MVSFFWTLIDFCNNFFVCDFRKVNLHFNQVSRLFFCLSSHVRLIDCNFLHLFTNDVQNWWIVRLSHCRCRLWVFWPDQNVNWWTFVNDCDIHCYKEIIMCRQVHKEFLFSFFVRVTHRVFNCNCDLRLTVNDVVEHLCSFDHFCFFHFLNWEHLTIVVHFDVSNFYVFLCSWPSQVDCFELNKVDIVCQELVANKPALSTSPCLYRAKKTQVFLP